MGTTKLKLYNGALLLIGENALSALTDDVKGRYVIDGMYDDALDFCLAQGLWAFATRAVSITSSVTPSFHYTYGFEIPSDLIRIGAVWTDDNEAVPITEYAKEGNYIYADVTPIYIQYISNDASWGLDLTKWPPWYVEYVKAHIAAEICQTITGNTTKTEEARKFEMIQRRAAGNRNAMEKPARFPPRGQWSNARVAGWRTSSLRGTGRGL